MNYNQKKNRNSLRHDIQFLPLDFSQSKINISLDGRVIFMSPSPLAFIDKNNTLLNSKYRFDGNDVF
ncbi:hypothetical protein AM629_20815 [Photorhabdus heterorhabditis]|uniref:PAS domain-containing protein n=1 Tax=Photorhabdus heterorhabditis TaxID=880156 RepID=A0ABR5K6X0_9GAMM|nr:hypothetical protein [Photorhabdus heterorhabditis]KOY60185.1 hypothetical protein AM629_20815 [Photorhabdus heterorhabditis]